MLELKTKKELAQYAHALASGQRLVRYRGVTYIPADYETLDSSVPPAEERSCPPKPSRKSGVPST